MKKTTILPLVLCAVMANAAWAAGDMKPGLWEMTMKSDAFKDMPQIPAAELEEMRKMGINMPQMNQGGMVSKVCITPQMAAQQAPGVDQMETGCQTKNFKRTGNNYSADIVCTGGAMKGSGKISGSFSGNERFASTYAFKGTMDGEPFSHNQETKGRWLGKDCGSVRP